MSGRFNEELITHLKKGEELAFTQLVDTYYKSLYTYACSLSHDKSQAEDIIQNVLLKIWINRKKLKEKLNIKSFLYRSVYNEFVDQYRKRQMFTTLEKKYIEALDTVVKEDNLKTEDYLEKIEKIIDNLPSKCKETFVLSKKEGLTNIEIAEYLNVSLKTVEAHITKAFGYIRKKLS